MRTHYCGQVTETSLDSEVTVCGWVHRRRDHGGVIFIDLRDHTGLIQIVANPETEKLFKNAESCRNEFVLKVCGSIRRRPEGTINKDLPTGTIELIASDLTVLSRSLPPPVDQDDQAYSSEDTRLKYRYLDLRREKMQKNLRKRHEIVKFIRDFLDNQGFADIETPILSKTTPEGARDYLVPSRTQPGNFFALPQSPQLMKQLLMISGFDRYYQIVKCFRDEDLRADRQPEFTQVDIETAFMDQEAITTLMERLIKELFQSVINIKLPDPFPVISYQDAIDQYGTDAPNTRFDMRLINIKDLFLESAFKVFADPAKNSDSRIVLMNLKQGSKLSRKEIDDYTAFVAKFGARGLAYIKVNDINDLKEGLQSPILKFLDDGEISAILDRASAETGDLIFFGAGTKKVVNDSMSQLRLKIAKDLNLYERDWAPLWVVDFPMFEKDKDGNLTSSHHPFTRPNIKSIEDLKKDPTKVLSHAYDMVLNGTEIGGGSLRIFEKETQKAVLEALGIDSKEADEKFGFLLQAMDYGCPPHGGIAFGLDRLVMIMLGLESIRETIAFPKTQTASDILTGAPSNASQEQLNELHLKLKTIPSE
ncbi:MAG: aspartate--tRNA ligase [Gammaproteobacteria bacterium]